MPKANVFNMAGEKIGEIELSEAIFGIEPNKSVLHDSVKNHLANCRQGTQSALTKGEVSYSTRKPWRQKGTGRARAGYTGSPVWTHGGVAFAPKPRDYSYTLNKKVKRLALKSVLSSKAKDGEIVVVDKIELTEAKTRNIVAMLKALGADKKALVIAQLQAAGIKVTSWLDHQIDVIVATLNKTGAWLATKTQEGISGMNQDTERSHE